MSNDRELRTRFSMAALDLATMFKTHFATATYGAAKFRAELDAPSEVSTAGGKLALQHLRLVSPLPGYTPLIVGGVNGPQHTVELRIYEYVDAAHRQRFGKPVPLDRPSYDQFIAASRAFFGAMQMEVKLQVVPAELRAAPPPAVSSGGSSKIWLIAGAIILAIGGVVAALLLKR